ncbi:hypothetical protein IG605_001295 [Pectobacterium quasiaquaticum]|uniref:hypothetical protein n=1 Tax=Pectobacterium quasiaquaticum TaxID=2774015 RepID=UPI0018756FC0|nr:hypothetical protein [Pectobacterium quasiaquaticum]URG53042.1 hypothetical protein IG605_001295 [Pectobacterium quasiaquaticum]
MKQLLNDFSDHLLSDFSKVVEGSSGALSFGVIQCLAVAVSVTKLDKVTGIEFVITFMVAVIATLGLFLCIFSVGKVIAEVAAENKLRKFLLYMLLYPAAVGVLISAKVSLMSVFH